MSTETGFSQNLVKPPEPPNSRQTPDSAAEINFKNWRVYPSGFAKLEVEIKFWAQAFRLAPFLFPEKLLLQFMTTAKGASRKGIPARVRSSARKAAEARGEAVNYCGDLGEAAFVYKATSLRLVVAKPYGQNHRYDFMVDGGQGIWRVQVKTCARMCHGLYLTCISCRKHRCVVGYDESDCDFVAAFIIPAETWYVLPVTAVVGHTSLSFRPKGYRLGDPYAHYREAWHLLRQPDGLTFG